MPGGMFRAQPPPAREGSAFFPPHAFDVEALPARRSDPLWWVVRRGALGLGLLAITWTSWRFWHPPPLVPSESVPAPRPRAAGVTAGAAPADSLEQALRSYGARVELFENHQMTCDDLARGLVAVDEQWLRYSIARRTGSESVDTLRDKAFAARAGGVEREFDASGCPRP